MSLQESKPVHHISKTIARHAFKVGAQGVEGVKNVIAVASGKGGVGKSTTAVNVALALAKRGARVGVLDADIYGPSIPTMLGAQGRPESLDGTIMEPLQAHGLELMSIGFLISDDQPAIWRGPMATRALEQLMRQTRWGDLDYLIVDMPPGTGDIALTLSERAPVVGAVIVSTPQDIALMDAKKALRMFEKVGVPVLGVVENMAVHMCSACGHEEHIFGADGAKAMAAHYQVPYLGSLPLARAIREQADSGRPTVVAEPSGAEASAYFAIADKLSTLIAALPLEAGAGAAPTAKFPTIPIKKG